MSVVDASADSRAAEIVSCEKEAGDFGDVGLDGGETVEMTKVVLGDGVPVGGDARGYRLGFETEDWGEFAMGEFPSETT